MANRPRSNSGRQLQREWDIQALHVLYHHEGTWYHLLERFPGALCDPNGYVLFQTEEDFRRNPSLKIGAHVRVPEGIWLRFSNGSEGVRDLSDVIAEGGLMVEPLKSKEYFDRVFVDLGAPTWPNGFDIAPDWLWREMDAAGELTHVTTK
jgi:hypothetical protein